MLRKDGFLNLYSLEYFERKKCNFAYCSGAGRLHAALQDTITTAPDYTTIWCSDAARLPFSPADASL
jgi:hypothetical protein